MRVQAALLKREIEAKLAHRIPAALSPIAQQAPRLHPLGIPQLDNLLGGGLPLGSLCELTGPDGSGRSSIALSLLSNASTEGVCAYIDVSGTLSPQSAAAVGVNLANLLWVHFAASGKQSSTQSRSPASLRTVEVKSNSYGPIHSGCGSSHPRGETKGLAPHWSRCYSTRRNSVIERWRARRATRTSRSACTRLHRIKWSGSGSTCERWTRPIPCGEWIDRLQTQRDCGLLKLWRWEQRANRSR